MIKKIVLSLSLVLIAILAVFLVGNDYQMKEQRVSIPTTGGTLSAVITAPKKKKLAVLSYLFMVMDLKKPRKRVGINP